ETFPCTLFGPRLYGNEAAASQSAPFTTGITFRSGRSTEGLLCSSRGYSEIADREPASSERIRRISARRSLRGETWKKIRRLRRAPIQSRRDQPQSAWM